MGNGALRRYRTGSEAEAVNHSSWRKPKQTGRAGSKDKASSSGPAAAQTWLAGGKKGPGGGGSSGSTARVSPVAASMSQDDEDDLAEFANLANAANKVWDDLMARKTNIKDKKDMDSLFGLSELKDAIERSMKRVEVLRRQADAASDKVDSKKAALDDLCSRFEGVAVPATVSQWKLGDMAIRRGKGFCELSTVHHEVEPPFFEVRMLATGSVVGTEAEKLMPLTAAQQSTARAALREFEKARADHASADQAVEQAQEELRQQHQSLTEQVEGKMTGVKVDLRGPGGSSSPTVSQEDVRGAGVSGPPTTSSASMPRQAPSGPAGFPSFDDLSRMEKEAQDRQRAEAARAAVSQYPTAHATREVFTRPEAMQANSGAGSTNRKPSQEAPARSASMEAPFVPAGMPGIPTSSAGPGNGAPKVSPLQQQRDQQEAYLQQQEAQRKQQEARQAEAQRQQEAQERQEQEARQRQESQRQQAYQQPQQPHQQQQPQTDWVVYRTAEGQVYYHNERTNQTSWSLPSGATCREPSAAGAGGQQQGGTYSQDDPFAGLRQQEEENRRQREQWQQWYQQYSSWYSQQAAAGATPGAETGGRSSGAAPNFGGQQQQGAGAGASAGAGNASSGQSLPPKGPAPPKLDAAFEDHAVYQIKSSVLKEMESMVNQGMEVSKRKKALRCLQLRWHPDKNPDKLEVANSIFQFIEETKPWFLHDPDGEDA